MLPVSQSQLTFTSGGKAIRIDCFLPSAVDQRLPAILGLHGSGGDLDGMSQPAGLLAGQGFAVYVLHYFNRTGTSIVNDRSLIFRHFFAWAKTVWDATSFVATQPQVDPERIGLMGFSLGAYLALSNAAVDPRIQAVVEFFGGLPREMKLFLRRLCPVLILHGDADATVPVAEAYYLQQVLESRKIPYEMKIYPGASHRFTDEVWRDAEQRTVAFFRKYLENIGAREGG
jgi:carboxymethylenebutenolidase